MKTPWTEEHARLVGAAAPTVEPAGDADIERVWNRIADHIGDVRPRRRRRVRMTVGAGVVAAVIGVSGFAAAEIFSAHTGRGPSDAEDLLLGGPGEKLDPAGPDFAAAVGDETDGIPFPSEAARQRTVDFWTADLTRDDPAPRTSAVSTGALRAWMASDAVCFWANEWAAATRDGDGRARGEAVGMIDAADTWPAVTDVDPRPYSRPQTQQVRDEDGSVRTDHYQDVSQFFYLARVKVAAAGTDPEEMARALLASGHGCWAHQVPDLPMADPTYAESHGWRP